MMKYGMHFKPSKSEQKNVVLFMGKGQERGSERVGAIAQQRKEGIRRRRTTDQKCNGVERRDVMTRTGHTVRAVVI